MQPFPTHDRNYGFGDILSDASRRLYKGAQERAAAGAEAEAQLLAQASQIMHDTALLPFDEFLMVAESIAKGTVFGSAAIVEKEAKKFWQDLIRNSLKFAANAGGVVLKLPLMKKSKS